jgi:multimeric flavodoxin WrbA
MADKLTRRKFIETVGAAAAIGTAVNTVSSAQEQKPQADKIRIIGIACSPRKGKTTAAALQICLKAAAAVDPRIETELIELAGMKIDGSLAAGLPLAPGQEDDFEKLVPKLSDPKAAGIIIGTPVYFGNMSYLCKAFLDRCMVLRKTFALSGKVGGVVAVGAARNGGQELTIQSVQAALLCQEMVIVGDGKPTGHTGATLWNNGKDDITTDEFGLATARNLGRRVAEVALRLAAPAK